MGELFSFLFFFYFSCGEAKKLPWRLEAADALLLLPNLKVEGSEGEKEGADSRILSLVRVILANAIGRSTVKTNLFLICGQLS